MESEPVARRRGGGIFWAFLVGVAAGVAGAILVPRWSSPYMPDLLQREAEIEGEVLEKMSEPDRLLLKVETLEGVFLASFTEKQKEIDLLIDQGDTVNLGGPAGQPFLEDPAIRRVRKPEPREPAMPRAPQTEETLGTGPGETLPEVEPEPETPPPPTTTTITY